MDRLESQELLDQTLHGSVFVVAIRVSPGLVHEISLVDHWGFGVGIGSFWRSFGGGSIDGGKGHGRSRLGSF